MEIKLNKINLKIDGKVYELYKMNFGFRRSMIEMQNNLNRLLDEAAKAHDTTVEEVRSALSDDTSTMLTDVEKLNISNLSLEMQEALAGLFVNPEDANILQYFDDENASTLIKAVS